MRTRHIRRSAISMALIALSLGSSSHALAADSDNLAQRCRAHYNRALEEISRRSGSDSNAITRRVEAVRQALKRCFTNGTEEFEQGVDKIVD